jgi:anti-sigma factor RsiW
MNCEKTEQVHAYYDGEMPLSRRGEFESHLQTCADCRALLSDLLQVSELIASAPLAEMPPLTMARLQNTWDAVRDRSVMRIASWLTAAAAAVLIGALLLWPGQRRDEGLRAATTWPAAVMPPDDSRDSDVASADLVGVAQWMANDLSIEQTR